MTLYEMVGDWKSLYDMADDPDMDPDMWFDTMEAIEGGIEVKAEGYGKLIKQFEADEAALKAEIDRLTEKKKHLSNQRERVKARMKESMEAIGKDKLKSGIFSFSIVKNGGKLPLIVEAKAAEVPEIFLTIPEPVINNEAVREALDAGEELEWAHYGERGTSLRVK